MKCPKCGYIEQSLSKQDRRAMELRYMINATECRYTGLLRLTESELPDDLQQNIKDGYVVRRHNGFFPTKKAKEYVDNYGQYRYTD